MAYFTGSRISEVLQLTVEDVSGDRVLFRAANTKMRKARMAMVVVPLQAFLDKYEFPRSGYLFPAHHDGLRGGHLSRQGADWMLRQVCASVGLDGVSTHSFRRSSATNPYRNGEPMAKICRLLGYKNLTMTARYIG
ncbi:MAG: site-specific integrase [Leptolyngbya sp. SIOISBB]|nr:site-specific integrase [Leptolyngbya sp. SIOISBB]